MKDLTVLITAAGNVFMPGITSCLKYNGERNIRLIGADMNDDQSMLQMVDSFYAVPRGNDPKYTDTLLDICEKEKVDVLLPIMSIELDLLANQKSKFESIGTKIAISKADVLKIANDKLLLFDFLKGKGMPCAKYFAVNSVNELEEVARIMGFPKNKVCVKATNGSGSRGFRIVDETQSRFDMFMHEKPNSCFIRMEELKNILLESNEFPQLMVMEYLPGDEYTVDILADNGKVLYNCCRRSLRMENSIMLDCIIAHNEDVEILCNKVVEELGLEGNIGFDVKLRSDGTPVIMECNPRITAGISAFAMAGVNLPYLCVKKLLGEKLPRAALEYGKVIHRRWMEM